MSLDWVSGSGGSAGGWRKMKLAFAILGVAATLASAGRAGAAMTFRTYQSTKYGYSLAVPAEWQQVQEKDSTITFTGSNRVLLIRIRPPARCTCERVPGHCRPIVL